MAELIDNERFWELVDYVFYQSPTQLDDAQLQDLIRGMEFAATHHRLYAQYLKGLEAYQAKRLLESYELSQEQTSFVLTNGFSGLSTQSLLCLLKDPFEFMGLRDRIDEQLSDYWFEKMGEAVAYSSGGGELSRSESTPRLWRMKFPLKKNGAAASFGRGVHFRSR